MTAEIQFETQEVQQTPEIPHLRIVETVTEDTTVELLGEVATQAAIAPSKIPFRTSVEWARINPPKRF